MRYTPDQALENLNLLLNETWSDLSESDTRSKIIDPFLKQCLNWQEEDIIREKHTVSGYADYIIKVRNKNKFIIEAKKEGHYFNLPVSRSRRYRIGGIFKKDKTIKAALTQAQDYCIKNGVRYGVITNGSQFIIFESILDGEEWENGHCVVFYSMDEIQKDFLRFWNILSKDAVEDNSLIDKVSKEIEELSFSRIVDGISYRNESQPRNDLYIPMSPVIDYAFEEITDEKRLEMLRRCYVYEDEFKEVDTSLKRKFSIDMPSITKEYDIKKIVQMEDTAGIFLTDFYRYSEILKDETPEPAVFVLLGRIGAGKTTFIHRFFNVVLSELEREKILWFYVNFRDAPIGEDEIKQYIIDGILAEFINKYNDKFRVTLEKLDYHDLLPTVEHLTKLFMILRLSGYTLSLIVDNVDQHRSKSLNFHEKVFLETNNLTKIFRTMTIVTLREESFYRSAIDGVFDAYYIKRYIINAPNFKKLILYRLNYILEKINLPDEKLENIIKTNLEIGTKKDNIRDFLIIVRDSVKRSRGGGISPFISATSGGDMRRALELFKNFLISGNTKITEILEKAKSSPSGSYQIAYHQFVKSIILGAFRYYSEESYLMNIFDFDSDNTTSHFLKLKILSYAMERVSNNSPIGRGYISINTMLNETNDLNIKQIAIEYSLLELAKYGLIILNTRSRSTLNNASFFKITDCGNYYLEILVKRFIYLDIMLSDTPIADQDLVINLRRLIHIRDLDARFDRTSIFINYLTKMEEREFQLHPEYNMSKFAKYRFMGSIKNRFDNEKKYIKRRVKINRISPNF